MSDDWYKHSPADFLDGVVDLSLEDVGAYAIILDYIYLSWRPLKDDDRYLAGLIRCDVRKWRAIRNRLVAAGKLIEIEGGYLDNQRAIEERSDRDRVRIDKRSAGHRGGIASGEARRNNGLAEAHASQTSNQIREEEKRGEALPNGSATRAREANKEFSEQFWPAYPHKVGKGEALKAFHKARHKASLQEILDGVQRYVASKPPEREWCNPSTFLNQERWTDQPAQTGPPQLPLGQEGWRKAVRKIEAKDEQKDREIH